MFYFKCNKILTLETRKILCFRSEKNVFLVLLVSMLWKFNAITSWKMVKTLAEPKRYKYIICLNILSLHCQVIPAIITERLRNITSISEKNSAPMLYSWLVRCTHSQTASHCLLKLDRFPHLLSWH